MRWTHARPPTALAVLYAGITVAVSSPPAQAIAESTMVLVASQYGGATCANNQKVIVANPFTGDKITGVVEPGAPPDKSFHNINEVKPYDNNSKVVALWGGSSGTQRGGVGVYDLVIDQWTNSFYLPSDFETGAESAHSITVLPDGYFAVAQTGSIAGAGHGFIVIFRPTDGAKVAQYTLSSAHGVEYDPRINGIYGIGYGEIAKWTYNADHTLSNRVSYPLPTDNGHDLRRRRNDDKYSVSTQFGTHVFDPATGGFTDLTWRNGTVITNAKSVDQRFDGLTEFNWFDNNSGATDTFNFATNVGETITTKFCTNVYKAGRWLYQPGDPDYNGSGGGGGGGGGTPTWSPTFTVGGGANSWWIEIYASSDVVSLDVIGKNGQFFMSNLPKHSWGGFGQSPPQQMTAGSLIKLIGRKQDGSSAGSITFPWLQNPNPATETGWNASFTIHQCNSKLEATISTAAVAAKVRIGTADWAVMTKNLTTGRWERSPGVPVGTKYLIRAYLAPGTEAAPQAYDLIRTC